MAVDILQFMLHDIMLVCKVLPETNALAYLSGSSVTTEKSFCNIGALSNWGFSQVSKYLAASSFSLGAANTAMFQSCSLKPCSLQILETMLYFFTNVIYQYL